MKDFKGTEIQVGHKVAFGLPGTFTMALGEVAKINTKTVSVLTLQQHRHRNGEWGEVETIYLRPFSDVVVLDI